MRGRDRCSIVVFLLSAPSFEMGFSKEALPSLSVSLCLSLFCSSASGSRGKGKSPFDRAERGSNEGNKRKKDGEERASGERAAAT